MEKRIPKLAHVDDCTGCMLCADVCHKDAIHFEEDKNGFWKPLIDNNICVGCLKCEQMCQQVRSDIPKNKCLLLLKGKCTDNAIRMNAASGGVFSALAIQMMRDNHAIVYGATLQHNKVFHLAIADEKDISLLQGSKYIQSKTCGIYRNVKSHLDNGGSVLFSGTPCQVQALNVYLGKTYDNLVTIDLICHGVMSNRIFQRHIKKNHCGEIIAFRDKTLGWGKDTFFKEIRDGEKYVDYNWERNFFYHTFQVETCFRRNCYKCQFCRLERVSDITIGDYWADRNSNNYDALGISTILCNTNKGRSYVINNELLQTEKADRVSSLSHNPRLFVARSSFLKFSCSNHLHALYKWLPNILVDSIVGIWRTKRLLPFWGWLYYMEHIRKKYDKDYEKEFNKILNNDK